MNGSLSNTSGMRARYRVPLKLAIFGTVLMFVTYPDPRLLYRQVGRIQNLESMIDPHAPELEPLEAQLRQRASEAVADKLAKLPAPATGDGATEHTKVDDGAGTRAELSSDPLNHLTAKELQKIVERLVYDSVPYDWDWNVWGAMDYVPTVAEMFEKAREYEDGRIREDCDGRAVLAASLLRRVGTESHLVTDIGHVWVRAVDKRTKKTSDSMSPGHASAIVTTSTGNRMSFDFEVIKNMPLAMSMGLSVFPFWRELIVYVAAVVLLGHSRMGWRRAAVGVLLSFAGFMLLRVKVNYWEGDSNWWRETAHFWMGAGYAFLGGCVVYFEARRARRAAAQSQRF